MLHSHDGAYCVDQDQSQVLSCPAQPLVCDKVSSGSAGSGECFILMMVHSAETRIKARYFPNLKQNEAYI